MTKNEFIGTEIARLLSEGTEPKDVFAKAETAYLSSDYYVARESKGTAGTRDELFELLRAGYLSEERYLEWLAAGTRNVRKLDKFFRKIVETANGIRDDLAPKFEADIEDDAEAESEAYSVSA